jgi:hypothetical protein
VPAWSVEDNLQIELDDVREVIVKIVGGDVSVTTAPGPARLEVRALRGGPVDVHHELGALRIFHPDWAWSGLRRMWEGLIGGAADVRIGGVRFGGGIRGPEASVTLTVPETTKLDVSAVSAPVVVAGLHAPANVRTVSGDLTLSDLGEVVDAKTVSGNLTARRVSGDLRVKTVSGHIGVADGACRWLDAKTVSGEVTFDLDLDPAGVYEIVTVSGDVGLRLPQDPSVQVEAASVSGRLDSDFDELRWDDHRSGRKRMRGRLGDGGARLLVRTVSGDLRMIRRVQAA